MSITDLGRLQLAITLAERLTRGLRRPRHGATVGPDANSPTSSAAFVYNDGIYDNTVWLRCGILCTCVTRPTTV